MLLKSPHDGFGKVIPTDVFLLGSGFSKAISSVMPTLADLSKTVLDRSAHLRSQLPPSAQENLEIALAFLSTRQPWLSESEYHRRVAEAFDLIAQVAPVLEQAELEAARCSSHHPPEWLLRFIYWLHDEHAVIITFNYDTLLEKTLAEIPIAELGNTFKPVMLNPRALYPTRFPIASHEDTFGTNWPTAEVLKLHGSINWSYSGAKEFFGEAIQYTPPTSWSADGLWARSEDKVPLIAPPIADKSAHFAHESLHHLWRVARRRLRGAERVYCIGFGFPDTDLAIRFLLADAQKPGSTHFYLIDVDERVIEKVKTFLPKHYELHLDFFGAEWIPKLLSHLWKQQQSEVGYDRHGNITARIRARLLASFRPGQDLPCIGSPPALHNITDVTERGVTILDRTTNVPLAFTWRSLAGIVAHLDSDRGTLLPIVRPVPEYYAMSVEHLLSPWYARACGRIAASVLTRDNIIFLHDDATVGGLNRQFHDDT